MKGYLAIVGATGCLGSKTVEAALDAGRGVAAIADDDGALMSLKRRHDGHDLVAIAGSVANDVAGTALAERLRALRRPLDGVVVAGTGESECGRLLDQPAQLLRDRLDADVLPHLIAARHLLPLLEESKRGGYVLIGGPGADHAWAGYGRHSVSGAALRMLARVLHDEARALAVRVQMLAVDSPLRTDANARHACDQWPEVAAVARHAVAMTAGAESPEHAIVHHVARAALEPATSPGIDAAQREASELLRTVFSRSRQQDIRSS